MNEQVQKEARRIARNLMMAYYETTAPADKVKKINDWQQPEQVPKLNAKIKRCLKYGTEIDEPNDPFSGLGKALKDNGFRWEHDDIVRAAPEKPAAPTPAPPPKEDPPFVPTPKEPAAPPPPTDTKPVISNADTEKNAQLLRAQVKFNATVERLRLEVVEPLKKKNETDPKHYQDALYAANFLLKELKTYGQFYFDRKTMHPETFKTQCNNSIENAQFNLKDHRGWGKIVRDLAFVIANILTIGIASGVHKLATGHARFFAVPPTKSVERLEGLKNEFNKDEEPPKP